MSTKTRQNTANFHAMFFFNLGRDFKSWKRVVWGGYSVVMVITTLFGIFAYVGFGDGVEDNVLSTFPIDDDVVVVGRLAMALSVRVSQALMVTAILMPCSMCAAQLFTCSYS